MKTDDGLIVENSQLCRTSNIHKYVNTRGSITEQADINTITRCKKQTRGASQM